MNSLSYGRARRTLDKLIDRWPNAPAYSEQQRKVTKCLRRMGATPEEAEEWTNLYWPENYNWIVGRPPNFYAEGKRKIEEVLWERSKNERAEGDELLTDPAYCEDCNDHHFDLEQDGLEPEEER